MKRFLCGILTLTLLVGSFAGCSNTSQGSPFPDADGFEDFLNKTIWNVLEIEDADYKEKMKCSDYEQSEETYTCNISGIVSYMGVIRDDKVVSMTAMLSYDAMSAFLEQDVQTIPLALLLMPAAIFDSNCSTTAELAVVMDDLKNYPVENTSNNKSYEHIYGDFEYSLDMMVNALFTGYMFQVRYLGENEDISTEASNENNTSTSEDVYEQLQQGEDNISPVTVCVTGVVERYENGWFISLSETLTVEDAGGMADCDELYFYEDTLDGRPISDYEGATVVVSGIPENYRGAGTYFLSNPILIDVHAKPPAEWEEMPLHKCINCGGTARLTGGAWCCDNCAAVYGEEDFAEKVSLDAFAEGTWWDTYSQRCNLTIDAVDDKTIAIEINWSSSASENTKWIITAKWDSFWGLLRYENGIMQNIDNSGTIVVYEDGSGLFYINSGNLYWVDYKESAGFDCVFEFPVY